ncbi:hypothetical protein [Nocardia cyriacigeorgica]|uniref:hypothetical protein n=1 Tax=Nocardia cyriacigeorgica TaxID=135487 RepID=UPI002B4B6350|nr:hypothetical protein [Nocardia cyriacigeorgica]
MPPAESAGAVGAGNDPVPGSLGTTVPIRPMTFRELLDTPFALIQSAIRPLAGFGAILIVAPELVIAGVTAGVSRLSDDDDAAVAWTVVVSTLICAWLVRFAMRGLTTAIGTAAVHGAPTDWRTALRRSGARLGPQLLFGSLFTLVGLAVLGLGTVLIIGVPFALLWLGWLRANRFVTVPVIFAEGANHRAAVARSKLLIAGTQWPTVWLWLCVRALLLLTALPLLGIPWFLSDFSGTHRWAVIVLTTSAVLLIVTFGEVVESATRVVVYVDRRCRREGMDIRLPLGAGVR